MLWVNLALLAVLGGSAGWALSNTWFGGSLFAVIRRRLLEGTPPGQAPTGWRKLAWCRLCFSRHACLWPTLLGVPWLAAGGWGWILAGLPWLGACAVHDALDELLPGLAAFDVLDHETSAAVPAAPDTDHAETMHGETAGQRPAAGAAHASWRDGLGPPDDF